MTKLISHSEDGRGKSTSALHPRSKRGKTIRDVLILLSNTQKISFFLKT